MMRSFLLLIALFFIGHSFCFASTFEGEKKEVLLRLPLLTDKNAQIILNSLDSVPGIKVVEACYELRVLIIGYDPDQIKDESFFATRINGLEINTVAEKIYSSDIPIIRNKYKITILRNTEKEIN